METEEPSRDESPPSQNELEVWIPGAVHTPGISCGLVSFLLLNVKAFKTQLTCAFTQRTSGEAPLCAACLGSALSYLLARAHSK